MADLEDPRFKQLFQSHEFALDPTDPRFASSKKGGVSKSLMKEVSRKKSRGQEALGPPTERARDRVHIEVSSPAALKETGGVDMWELKKMVNKLKRKAG